MNSVVVDVSRERIRVEIEGEMDVMSGIWEASRRMEVMLWSCSERIRMRRRET